MEILAKDVVCEMLGVSVRGLEMMVNREEFPPGKRIGKKVFWCVEAVENWEKRMFEAQRNWKPRRL